MRRTLVAALALLLAAAGCGGDDGGGGEAADDGRTVTQVRTVTAPGTTARPPVTVTEGAPPGQKTPTGIVTVTVPRNTAMPQPRATGKPRFQITLTADGHEAEVGERWEYVVRATRNGKPVGATAKMRVFVGSKLVDTIGFFAFEGTLRRAHRWPAVLKGEEDVVLQAEVEGTGGTRRVNWPVDVR